MTNSQNFETILYTRDRSVVEIRFNRPSRLNAVIEQLYLDILTALDAAAADPDARAIMLTGEGRAFCVGADLKEHGAGERTFLDKRRYLELANDVCRLIYEFPKPVIAAVNGYAAGAGAEMAISSDFIVMKASAQLWLPEISIGTHIGGGVTDVLPRLVGLTKARELIFTGEKIDGTEAHRIGLATHVFADDTFAENARGFANVIGSKAPVSMRRAKACLNASPGDYRARLTEELDALLECMLTDDWQEGVDAFAEKRQPVFKGG